MKWSWKWTPIYLQNAIYFNRFRQGINFLRARQIIILLLLLLAQGCSTNNNVKDCHFIRFFCPNCLFIMVYYYHYYCLVSCNNIVFHVIEDICHDNKRRRTMMKKKTKIIGGMLTVHKNIIDFNLDNVQKNLLNFTLRERER